MLNNMIDELYELAQIKGLNLQIMGNGETTEITISDASTYEEYISLFVSDLDLVRQLLLRFNFRKFLPFTTEIELRDFVDKL